MGKVVCPTEQDLQQRRPQGTRRIERHIGNRAKGKNLTSDHQADDKARPTGGGATIHSRPHDDQQEEEGANRLHGNGYHPATSRSVEVDSATKVRRAKTGALRRGRPAKGEGDEQRAQDSTKELRHPIDHRFAPADTPGDGQ